MPRILQLAISLGILCVPITSLGRIRKSPHSNCLNTSSPYPVGDLIRGLRVEHKQRKPPDPLIVALSPAADVDCNRDGDGDCDASAERNERLVRLLKN